MVKTIGNNTVCELEIKKSRFIGYTFKVQTVEDVDGILNSLNKEHSSATHICFAYVLSGQEKCSDNGEPSGTAGLPMLEVIKKNGLTNILVVVVRYFGGIKLGAGGLIRAYSKCASLVIKESEVCELELYDLFEAEVDYASMPIFNKVAKDNNVKVLSISYENNVICTIATNKDVSIFNNIVKSITKTGQEWF